MLKNLISLHITSSTACQTSNTSRITEFTSSLENRDKGTRMFIEFFGSMRQEEVGKEMRGHIILDNINDLQESIVLTFWETKEDMDKFYMSQNKALANLVKRAQPLFGCLNVTLCYLVATVLPLQDYISTSLLKQARKSFCFLFCSDWIFQSR